MVIGITGSISAGKSSVLNILKDIGVFTISADEVYHQMIKPSMPLFNSLIEEWGKDILDIDGNIDRNELSKIVFADPVKLKRLNEITHPAIIGEIKKTISENKNRDIVVEIPLLFETKCEYLVDVIWYVDISRENRISRLMNRNNILREEAIKKIEKYKYYGDLADVIIYNDGTFEDLKNRVVKLWNEREDKNNG